MAMRSATSVNFQALLVGQTVLEKCRFMVGVERDPSINVGLYQIPKPF
jgi:hypothetical protein